MLEVEINAAETATADQVTSHDDVLLSCPQLTDRWGIGVAGVRLRMRNMTPVMRPGRNGQPARHYRLSDVVAWEEEEAAKPVGLLSFEECVARLGINAGTARNILGAATACVLINGYRRAFYAPERVEEAAVEWAKRQERREERDAERQRARKERDAAPRKRACARASRVAVDAWQATPMPPREELVAHRAAGLKREEIAAIYGISVSRVKRWIKELAIPTPRRGLNARAVGLPKGAAVGKGTPLPDDDGITLIEKAQTSLMARGIRMRECRRTARYEICRGDGYRPVRVSELLRLAGLRENDVRERALTRLDGGLRTRDEAVFGNSPLATARGMIDAC